MKKKLFFAQIAYYLLALLLILGCLGLSALVINATAQDQGLGFIIMVTNVFLYLFLPMLTVMLVRFSLLKWYADPFAAAVVPLVLYLLMVIKKAKTLGSLAAGFEKINHSLLTQNGEGLLFFIGLFLLGVLVSFSPARKNEKNLSYRFLYKIKFLR